MVQETAVWRRKFQPVSQSLLTQERQRKETVKFLEIKFHPKRARQLADPMQLCAPFQQNFGHLPQGINSHLAYVRFQGMLTN